MAPPVVPMESEGQQEAAAREVGARRHRGWALSIQDVQNLNSLVQKTTSSRSSDGMAGGGTRSTASFAVQLCE